MNDHGKVSMFRGTALGLAGLGLAGLLAGCQGAGGATNGGGGGGGGAHPLLNPSYASFSIAKDTADPTLLVVSPTYGDAWLDAEPREPAEDEAANKIVWSSDESFDIKFVQIDDPTKNPRKKFGPTQQNGWKAATCDTAGKPCVFELPLFKGNGGLKKEIRGAKYMLRSPSNCSSNCATLDPVIIVRY